MMMDDKAAARDAARARRSAISALERDGAGAKAAVQVLATIPLAPDTIIAAYWPLGDEFDCRPLMYALLNHGHRLALPVVLGRHQPLCFRAWHRGDTMAKSSFGVFEPTEAAEPLNPAVVMAPFLACNAQGFRLGYGGGYYDRTLRSLREEVPGFLAVGMGFAGQVVAALPHDNNDEPLDWLVTEQDVTQF